MVDNIIKAFPSVEAQSPSNKKRRNLYKDKVMKNISLRLSYSPNFWACVLAWFRTHVGSAEDCATALQLGIETVDCQIIDLLRSGLIVPAPSEGQYPHFTGKEAHDEKRQFRFL